MREVPKGKGENYRRENRENRQVVFSQYYTIRERFLTEISDGEKQQKYSKKEHR